MTTGGSSTVEEEVHMLGSVVAEQAHVLLKEISFDKLIFRKCLCASRT